jgi:hypothetical protein
MNFLQKLISRGVLKSIEKLASKDPIIRAKFDKLAKDSNDLAKSIDDFNKRNSDLFTKQ